MPDIAEIKTTIEKLPPEQIYELACWLGDRVLLDESPEMLHVLDQGIWSLENEPTVPLEEVAKKIKVWATG
ncbi:MAG: hypothetical protein JWM35_2242 [Verrucomicrobia bacterium]|nr:hypothetical protein [Verrucomicrobiota bacterium]